LVVWEPDDAFVAPIAWPVETQRSFAHYFALIVRMTQTFPQTAAFTDVAGRVRLDAEVYRTAAKPRGPSRVRLRIRAESPLHDSPLDTELTLYAGAFHDVVAACGEVFPGLSPKDVRDAWG
jgi:hypothetical protein